jgi:putative glycosyltransferase
LKLSIVATLYDSAPYIQEFVERASKAAEKFAGEDYEIILVNDGSPDSSLEIAVETISKNPSVFVIDLSRNFGHHKAMMTGLQRSQGDMVFLIDSDLEEDPLWLANFAMEMQARSADVVFGIQKRRKGALFERLSGALYYFVINKISDLKIPTNSVTARLMTREYVNALCSQEERETVMFYLWASTGFNQVSVNVTKKTRKLTTYHYSLKLRTFINSITSLSVSPLNWIFNIGLVIFLSALCYTSYIVMNWLHSETTVEGWTTVVVSIWLLGGLTILCLGVIAIYMSKILLESKKRPNSIIKKIYKR